MKVECETCKGCGDYDVPDQNIGWIAVLCGECDGTGEIDIDPNPESC